MTGPERGFLLLTSHLGDPGRRPLTVAQLRTLTQRARAMSRPGGDRELTPDDLKALGYGREEAERITALLEQEDVLEHYLEKARRLGCQVLTRVSPDYPQVLLSRMGDQAPGVLWYRGELAPLTRPMVALVGSRDILPDNAAFAAEAGRQAALQDLTLVSGNARGADRIAQDACLEAGGRVVSVAADALCGLERAQGQLLLSEDSFDAPFTSQRALSRNRVIHALPLATLAAQVTEGSGGTWDGSLRNLRWGWSPLYCYDDGGPGVAALAALGAQRIGMTGLTDLAALARSEPNLFQE